MKKIVIVPTFCESHLIKYQIPNIVETINPDYIIYKEGLFPKGTEGNKKISNKWLDEYTLDGRRGFDYLELKSIVEQAQQKYNNTKIILDPVNYDSSFNSTQCYTHACTNLEHLDIKFETGDYIFPYEGDVFHHENDKRAIENYMSQIDINQGFRSIWIDFIENQFYIEGNDIFTFLNKQFSHLAKSRRICIKYGDANFYQDVLSRFMTVTYHDYNKGYGNLYPTDLITFHYAWFRPDKFKKLRCDQLDRPDGYWNRFLNGVEKCNELKYKRIIIRPHLIGKPTAYAEFYDKLEHPSHIKSHPCYINYDQSTLKDIEQNNLIFQ